MIIGSTELMKRTGISYRRLQYWTRAGIIPTVEGAWVGSGYKLKFEDSVVEMVKFLVKVAEDLHELGNNNVGLLHLIAYNWNKGSIELGSGLRLTWGYKTYVEKRVRLS